METEMDKVGINMKGFIDDEPITTLSLAKDFGGVLPSVNDTIRLPLDNNTYEVDYFRVAERSVVPGEAWRLDIEPISEDGWVYRRKLVEVLYQGAN